MSEDLCARTYVHVYAKYLKYVVRIKIHNAKTHLHQRIDQIQQQVGIPDFRGRLLGTYLNTGVILRLF